MLPGQPAATLARTPLGFGRAGFVREAIVTPTACWDNVAVFRVNGGTASP